MPRFSFLTSAHTEVQRKTLASDDEWTISSVVSTDPVSNDLLYTLEIKRQNSIRNDSVSGELCISKYIRSTCSFSAGSMKEFSKEILPKDSLVIISVEKFKASKVRNLLFQVFGYLVITENSDKSVDALQIEKSLRSQETQTKSLENKESKKEILQKSLAEKLLNDFDRLLDPKTSCFADVILKCGDATIAAHKSILSARSPIFAAMFANSMKESIKNEVEITDIDLPTINALLVYMYTSKISAFTEQPATDLLFAADKYQLHELKRVCSDFLKDTMSLQNVLRILALGDMIDEDLKSFAVNYICNKCTEFSALENTEEWKNLQKERPALIMEVFTSLVKSMNEKLKK